ncbi:MAG: VOC family protein [Cyanobacteria bacterium J06623_1]
MSIDYSEFFVTISTEQIQLIVDFYSQLLSQKPKIYRPQIYAEFQLGGLRLAIFQPKPEHQSEFANRGSSLSFCLEVQDLEQAIAHLTDLGYPPPGEVIAASHGKEAYAYDPDGNRLILHQAIAK